MWSGSVIALCTTFGKINAQRDTDEAVGAMLSGSMPKMHSEWELAIRGMDKIMASAITAILSITSDGAGYLWEEGHRSLWARISDLRGTP